GGAGAHGQPDVVGVVPAGGEDLLSVDDVVVAVTHGGGAQGGEVGTCFRFGVADREMYFAGEDGGQELPLLFVGAVYLQGRADGLQGDARERHVGADGFVGEDLLFDVTESVASELDGPPDAQ